MTVDLDSPGALAVAFANTTFMRRGVRQEDLDSPAALAAWCEQAGIVGAGEASPGSKELERALALRDATRALLASDPAGALDAGALQTVNATNRAAPAWTELDARASRRTLTDAEPVARALRAVAADLVDLLASERRAELHACASPGCIRFFLAANARQEACSKRCADRVRAARYYARQKARGGDQTRA